MTQERFDIVGDVHGRAPELVELLRKLGYSDASGVWAHKDRRVIFLGDSIHPASYGTDWKAICLVGMTH